MPSKANAAKAATTNVGETIEKVTGGAKTNGTKTAMTVYSTPVIVEAAEGFKLVSMGEERTTLPALATFPLAVSKSGRYTGKFENIGVYCVRTTGMAFTQSQADAIKDNGLPSLGIPKGRKLEVISTDDKKAMSDKFDDLRKQYFATAKAEAAKVIARGDSEIDRIHVRQTAKGTRFNIAGIVPTVKDNAENVLRRQLAEAQATIAELTSKVSPKTAKAAKAKAHRQTAIEVPAVVTPGAEAPAAPVQEPAPAAA